MSLFIRVFLLFSLIVPVPREADAAEAIGSEPKAKEAAAAPGCDSLALVQARFLLDDADRQPQLSVAQLELLGECKVSMLGIELEGRNLGGIALPGADLTNAELARSDFSDEQKRANLRGTKLNGANLEAANLQGADLREADLRHTFLRATDLTGANLSGARMGWPHAIGQAHEQRLTAAQLTSACWSGENPPEFPASLSDYERPEGSPSACPDTP